MPKTPQNRAITVAELIDYLQQFGSDTPVYETCEHVPAALLDNPDAAYIAMDAIDYRTEGK